MAVPEVKQRIARALRQIRNVVRMTQDELREDAPNLDQMRLQLGVLRLELAKVEGWIGDVRSFLNERRNDGPDPEAKPIASLAKADTARAQVVGGGSGRARGSHRGAKSKGKR